MDRSGRTYEEYRQLYWDERAERRKLESKLAEAIKWIQHDCPWDEETIREQLKGDKP